jgi:hypothetical protein
MRIGVWFENVSRGEKGTMGSRVAALTLFVLGQSALAALSLGVAIIPAVLTFVAGSALLVRSA